MIKILTYPDTFLRQVSKDIENPVSVYDLELIESMKDTMYESKGIVANDLYTDYVQTVQQR